MTTEKTLRESVNNAFIEGLVKDIRIEEKKVGGKDAIAGEIDIQVDSNSIHTVNVFSFKYKQNSNEISGLYKIYSTVKDEYKSIESHGEAEADKVRIEQGRIGKNEYVGQDGEFKSYPHLSTTFINRVRDNDAYEPKARFTLEMVVANKTEEKRNGEETGRLILKGYVLGYQEGKDDTKKIFPFEVIVSEPQSVNYVQNTYEKGNTVTVYGEIVNQTIVTKKEVEVGFGAPQENIERKTVREYVVDGGTEPLEEEDKNAYDPKLIKEALKKREAAIEKKKEEKARNSSQSNGGSGFGKQNPFADDKDPFAEENDKPLDISDEDLPF